MHRKSRTVSEEVLSAIRMYPRLSFNLYITSSYIFSVIVVWLYVYFLPWFRSFEHTCNYTESLFELSNCKIKTRTSIYIQHILGLFLLQYYSVRYVQYIIYLHERNTVWLVWSHITSSTGITINHPYKYMWYIQLYCLHLSDAFCGYISAFRMLQRIYIYHFI